MRVTRRKLVVAGNGMAGARAVEEVLARGGADLFDIVMFGDEPYGNYNRIMLSNLLNGTQVRDEIYINPLDWYAENGITLHAGDRVVGLDRAAKVVTGASGRRERYDYLVISTGSRPFVPPIKGLHEADGTLKRGVFTYRTLDDVDAMTAFAKGGAKVAVTIGGGLLGLEAARGLKALGLESHVVHLGAHLLEVQLDVTGGGMLRKTLESMGLSVHLGKSTTEAHGEAAITGLSFKDGTSLDCDMVVMSAGIRPNVELGHLGALTVERAIVVDDHMRSVDDPDVYVVGECAQHRGRLYGLVSPLYDQAKVFADHVTGRNVQAAYHGSKLATKLKVSGIDVASMGITDPQEERDEMLQFIETRRGTYKKLIVRENRLVGCILMGDISKAAYLMQAFDRDAPLPEERLALLFDLGTPSEAVSLAEMPATMQVCNCNGVTKGAIAACVSAGKDTLPAVMAATRAGMGCGSCKAQVGELVAMFNERDAEAAAAEPARAA